MIARSASGARPTRRALLQAGTLGVAATGIAASGLATGHEGRPPSLVWVLLTGGPAVCDLAAPELDGSETALERATDGFGGRPRSVVRTRSPFAPCGASSDALQSVAARGGLAVRGIHATDPFERFGAERFPSARHLSGIDEVPHALRAGEREVLVVDDTDWSTTRGLPARAAALDSRLRALLRDPAWPEEATLVLLGTCARRPYARLGGGREAGGTELAVTGLGPLVEVSSGHDVISVDLWVEGLRVRAGLA